MATPTDICSQLDTEEEFFCHVCDTNDELHYAKVNINNGRGTLYESHLPQCARTNLQHKQAFLRECFPSGMGKLRSQFFPGLNTQSCASMRSEGQKMSSRLIWGIIWTVVFIFVCAYVAANMLRGGTSMKTKINSPIISPASSLHSDVGGSVQRVIKIPYRRFNRI